MARLRPFSRRFDSEGRLDDLGQREFLDFLSESGAISALFLRCGMGQMREFSYDEVKQIADNACAHMKGARAGNDRDHRHLGPRLRTPARS